MTAESDRHYLYQLIIRCVSEKLVFLCPMID